MLHYVQLVFLGGLRIDYLISASGEVVLRQCGGNALFSASGAAVWDASVGIVGRVGQNYPREWLDQAARRGIDITGVHWLDYHAEMRTFFAHAPGGGRAEGDPAFHFSRLGLPVPADLADYTQLDADQEDQVYRPLWLHPEDIPASYGGARAFHLAPMNWEAHLTITAALRKHGAPFISLDPGVRYMATRSRAEVEGLLRQVDIFLPSDLEVEFLLGATPPEEAARWFAACGPRVVVIKQGARGVLIYERERDLFTRVAPYPIQIRDVTGAGDAFCGGFVVGYVETGDPQVAARYGVVSASFVLEDYGALYALRYHRADALARLAADG